MIGDVPELGVVPRGRELIVRNLGSCFIALAAGTGSLGVVAIAAAFREAARLGPVPNETLHTIGILAKPAIVSVLLGWLLLDVGRGLRRLSPRARWGALAFLLPACVAPLVIFFSAMRAGAHPEAIAAIVLLAIPAAACLALAAPSSDPLFSSKYRPLQGSSPGPVLLATSRFGLMVRILVMVIGMVLTLLLVLCNR